MELNVPGGDGRTPTYVITNVDTMPGWRIALGALAPVALVVLGLMWLDRTGDRIEVVGASPR